MRSHFNDTMKTLVVLSSLLFAVSCAVNVEVNYFHFWRSWLWSFVRK